MSNIDEMIEKLERLEQKSKYFYDLGYNLKDMKKKTKAFNIAHKLNQRIRKLSDFLTYVYNRVEQEENYKANMQKERSGLITGTRLRFVK